MILPLASGVFAPLAPGDRPAFWAVTGRLGGHSVGAFAQANIAQHVGDNPKNVFYNRDELAALVHISGRKLAVMEPIHGKSIAKVTKPGSFAGVDSLMSDQCDLGLVAMGADCVPLIFYGSRGSDSPVISAVHCGWKGLVAGVVTATLIELRAQGVDEIKSVVGPAICGACYSCTPARRRLVQNSTRFEMATAALAVPGGIDVRAGVLAELSGEGITPIVVGGCTFENPETLFSYRRENKTGRQGIIISMRDHQVQP
jgi:YfiH family protein